MEKRELCKKVKDDAGITKQEFDMYFSQKTTAITIQIDQVLTSKVGLVG